MEYDASQLMEQEEQSHLPADYEHLEELNRALEVSDLQHNTNMEITYMVHC